MASRVRLLVAGISWPPETFIFRLLKGLADAGAEVSVAVPLALGTHGSVPPYLTSIFVPPWNGSVLKRLLRLGKGGVRGLFLDPSFVRTLRGRSSNRAWNGRGLANWNRLLPLAGHSWDVVYFPWNSAAIEHAPLFDTGAPVIVSCRGAQVNIAPHNPARAEIREGLKWVFSRAAAVHCVSDAIKGEAIHLGLDPAKAVVIRPAVDPSFFCPAVDKRFDEESVQIVTTGSLIWRKGYEYALSAISRMRSAGHEVTLDIVGEGPELQRLLYTIDDLGLRGTVRLRGRLAPEEVRDLLQKSDIFLLSSLSEGISNAVLEAMACGLPVVTSDCGGMREAVTDCTEGFVVPVRDSRSMADALMRLASDVDLRLRMGRAARQRILDEFSLDQQVDAFSRLVADVAERKAATN